MIDNRKKQSESFKKGIYFYNLIKQSILKNSIKREYVNVMDYSELVYNINLKDENGVVSVYSEAIQTALNENPSVYIPYVEYPLYLDGPIILNSGNSLKVHKDTRLILIGDTCMIHNRNVIDGHYIRLHPGIHSDRDISISGGVWELPYTVRLNDNPYRDYPGCDAGFVLHNIINVTLKDMTIRNTNRMGVQLGNCEGFLVENIKFENAGRDGIHLEGPAAYGVIRDIKGRTGDDVVALNAWDWDNASLTFGPIHDVIVEDIECEPGYLWSELRFHPGNKLLSNGQIIECPLYNIYFKNIRGVHTIKIYNQPNLMPGYQNDRSMGLGSLYNIYFEDIIFDYLDAKDYYTKKNAGFEIHADISNINFKDIQFNFPLKDKNFSDYTAIGVGPISDTWKVTDNPIDWFDFFETDSICRINKMEISDVTVEGKPCTDIDKLLLIRCLKPNPDYPRTVPKGGTGFGIVDNLNISNGNLNK